MLLATASVADDRFLLITRDRSYDNVQIVEVSDRAVRIRDESGAYREFDRLRCIGAINRDVALQAADEGMLVLTDSQRFPGRPRPTSNDGAGSLTWHHVWFESLRMPLDRISWARFGAADAPPVPGDEDVVVLGNGDRVEGLVESIGEQIEVDRAGERVSLDLELVRALRLVNPPAAQATDLPRVWLRNGTVVDVEGLHVGEDGYVRFAVPLAVNPEERGYKLSFVAGVLFRTGGFTALATIPPHDPEGPRARYVLPRPRIDEMPAALDLEPIEFSGPITTRYTLPTGPLQFSATARLASSAGEWSDCEVVLFDDDREVFRARLTPSNPAATVSIPLTGSELTVEVTEGAHGPIQDRVVLEQAMLIAGE